MTYKAETAILTGKVYYAKLKEVDDLSQKYQVHLYDLDDTSRTKVVDAGVRPKNNEEVGDFITARSKFKVKVKDASTREDIEDLLGNGSSVKIKVKFNKTHPMAEKHGTSMYLQEVRATDLIPYGDDDWDEEDEEDEEFA